MTKRFIKRLAGFNPALKFRDCIDSIHAIKDKYQEAQFRRLIVEPNQIKIANLLKIIFVVAKGGNTNTCKITNVVEKLKDEDLKNIVEKGERKSASEITRFDLLLVALFNALVKREAQIVLRRRETAKWKNEIASLNNAIAEEARISAAQECGLAMLPAKVAMPINFPKSLNTNPATRPAGATYVAVTAQMFAPFSIKEGPAPQ